MQIFPLDITTRPTYADKFNGHKGTDIFAPRGTNVFAVEAGTVRQSTDPKGGTVAYLTTADGTKYYYAHLDEFIGASPRKVTVGEVIGTVGTTGNAQSRAPHLHFQVSLPDVGTVNPFPLLQAVDPKRARGSSSRSSALQRASGGGLVLLFLAAYWLLK